MDVVNEKTTAYATVTFLNKAGEAETPDSVSYSVYCTTTDTEMKASTSLTPATSIEIELTPAVNGINSQLNGYEYRLITVIAIYAGDAQMIEEYTYGVKNLNRIT